MKTFIAILLILSCASAKVKIDVYMESQCPDCQGMIRNSIEPAMYRDGFFDMVELNYYPYGNAQTTTYSNGTKYVRCQHGANECLGNVYENCVLAHTSDKIQRVLAIGCMEKYFMGGMTWAQTVPECAKYMPAIDVAAVNTCATTTEGLNLHVAAGEATPKDHRYVPWVVVNGVHDTNQENAIIYNAYNFACSMTPVAERPAGCSSASFVAAPAKIEFALYYEALCPYCQDFVANNLSDALDKGVLDMANIKVVPFGNARVNSSGKISCQHGSDECTGNRLENCVLDRMTKANQSSLNQLKAIVCLETKGWEQGATWASALQVCAPNFNLNVSDLTTCYTGAEGEALHRAAGEATPKDHQYVPWVVVDGTHVNTNDENEILGSKGLFPWICNKWASIGGTKPANCPSSNNKMTLIDN